MVDQENKGNASSQINPVRRFIGKICDALKDVKITLPLGPITINIPLNRPLLPIAIVLVIISAVIAYVSLAPKKCFYHNDAKADIEAIPWLINQEAQATESEDIVLITKIFTDDAMIIDYYNRNSPVVWINPMDRYQPLFRDNQYIDDQNTEIKAINITSDDVAYYISGSRGVFVNNGQTYPFQNPGDANHWTLRKIKGCWKITKFEFNASGVKFP